ncbi:ATP-binding protein [Campylobacter sp.]|uniref:ATP-binding protein n=1 Tax=Campylobacter sp. TaxID=205 RepID=UPI002A80E2D8|nr:ATP-binding protein [Campylobacter sp.]MCI7237540.1 ATP-binding protein [Campylobacter sp.]MDY4802709.1 ATP-binding protein [Campylobacter sp.]MDY4829565.1 ATP-binding protein [Campylobacter sp.]
MQKLHNRKRYFDELLAHKDKELIKIITGIRRCGKSSLLELFKEHLKKQNAKFIHINFESLEFEHLSDYKELYKYIKSKIKSGKYYLLFDEIQVVKDWQKAIESFRLDFECDIYITGSNSHLLSGEFSTYLTGRFVEIKLLPLSFAEFLEFHELGNEFSLEDKFQKYLIFGGMPILAQYKMDEINSFQALEGIISSILQKDILARCDASYILLEKITKFLASNIGSLTSPNNISSVLTSDKNSISRNSVDKYIKLLTSSFVFYEANRYDIKGKALLKTGQKYYIADTGFLGVFFGRRDSDFGHILENIVFLELLRRGYSVQIGKIGELEIDFVASNLKEKIYIQVSQSIMDEKTRNRELRALQSIPDNYEKIIISMDKNYALSKEGIKIKNAIEWLLEMEL